MKALNQTFYKVNRRKRGLPFVWAPKTCSYAPQLPPSFESPFTLPPKNERPFTVEKLPPHGSTAEKLPPYFGFTASAKVVTARKRQTAYRRKITSVWHYRRKITDIFWFYRQKTKNSLPPKNYRRMALPPRLCPSKKALPTITLEICEVAGCGKKST